MSWAITVLVLLLLLAFVWHLVGLARIPTGHRPLTPTYDRLGRRIEDEQNPDYHENPGE